MNETFLVFVVGGVMLGGASLLAPRPEAFLTFLLPTGLLTAVRSGQRRRCRPPDDGIPGGCSPQRRLTTWRFHLMIDPR